MLDDPRVNASPIRLTLEPLDDYVVIEPTDEEAETRAGLILPASAEARLQLRHRDRRRLRSRRRLSPGDKVLFPADAGYDVRLGGTAAKVIRRRELIARIHD